MVAHGELLEWATVFENRYGTPRAPVEAALSAGYDVLFDIDWQGTQQLRSRSPSDVVSVFILPPSAQALEQRLHTRAQDSDEVIRSRMKKAGDEMSHFDAYDYIIVNDNIGMAFEAVKSILRAEQLKRERQIGLSGFVRGLQRSWKTKQRSARGAPGERRERFRNSLISIGGAVKIAFKNRFGAGANSRRIDPKSRCGRHRSTPGWPLGAGVFGAAEIVRLRRTSE